MIFLLKVPQNFKLHGNCHFPSRDNDFDGPIFPKKNFTGNFQPVLNLGLDPDSNKWLINYKEVSLWCIFSVFMFLYRKSSVSENRSCSLEKISENRPGSNLLSNTANELTTGEHNNLRKSSLSTNI